MEGEKVEDEIAVVGVKSSSSSSSSWPIFHGDFHGVVTCESSISDDGDPHHGGLLILRRPTSDPVPCEITICFTQLHEIKQIYVRSTARVFEIYYATDEKGENEYLCTVRCGIAARDEELPETDGGSSLSARSSVSNVNVDEGHFTAESGSSANEDGWVDVKVLDSSKVDTGSTSLSGKKDSQIVQGTQDRFEATAEISDADPVLSITLRLLSIQSGDHLYVDEIYVFADPVESIDDQTAPSLESSSGVALLSMFIPTLMQLSKSRDNRVQEKYGCDAGESTIQDSEQRSTAAALMSTNTSEAEITPSSVPNGVPHSICLSEIALQTPNLPNGPQLTYGEKDFPPCKIEQTLDKLVSRVSRIEDICLRFEENMLKPIIMMQTRLERVEQQLESIIKDPQFCMTGCTRFSAPEFSCNDSERNSVNTGRNDCPPVMMKSESSEKDGDCCEELCVAASDVYSCADVQCHDVQTLNGNSKAHPGLHITAPDFSCSEEEGSDFVAAEKDSLNNASSKRHVSIDDALASALAGFLPSALIKPVRCTEVVQEVDIVSAVEGSGGSPTSSSALSLSLNRPLECSQLADEAESFSGIERSGNIALCASVQSDELELSSALACTSKPSSTVFSITENKTLATVNDGEETTEADYVSDYVHSEGGCKKPPCGSSSVDCLGKLNLIEGTGSTEANGDDGVSDLCDSVDCRTSMAVIAGASGVPGVSVESSLREGAASKCPVLLEDIIELPSRAVVDFSAPLLDVKFLSLHNISAKSSLEALLVDMPSIGCEDPCIRDNDASSCSEPNDNLVRIEDDSSRVLETSNDHVLLLDYCKSARMPSEAEQEDGPNCSIQGICTSLI